MQRAADGLKAAPGFHARLIVKQALPDPAQSQYTRSHNAHTLAGASAHFAFPGSEGGGAGALALV